MSARRVPGPLSIAPVDDGTPLPAAPPEPSAAPEPAARPPLVEAPEPSREPALPEAPRSVSRRSTSRNRLPRHTPAEYRDAKTMTLHVQVPQPLHTRYGRMIADLKFDEQFKTNLTEVTNALLHEGPSTGSELRELVERWREATEG